MPVNFTKIEQGIEQVARKASTSIVKKGQTVVKEGAKDTKGFAKAREALGNYGRAIVKKRTNSLVKPVEISNVAEINEKFSQGRREEALELLNRATNNLELLESKYKGVTQQNMKASGLSDELVNYVATRPENIHKM